MDQSATGILKCFKCNKDVEILVDENTMNRIIIYCPECEYSLYPNYTEPCIFYDFY